MSPVALRENKMRLPARSAERRKLPSTSQFLGRSRVQPWPVGRATPRAGSGTRSAFACCVRLWSDRPFVARVPP